MAMWRASSGKITRYQIKKERPGHGISCLDAPESAPLTKVASGGDREEEKELTARAHQVVRLKHLLLGRQTHALAWETWREQTCEELANARRVWV